MNTDFETQEMEDCAEALCQCRPVLGLSGVNSRHPRSQNRFCNLAIREALPLLLALAAFTFPFRQADAQQLNNQTVKLWDVATGKELRSWSGKGDTTCVSFSRDGKTVAIGKGDRTVTLLEAGTGRLLHRLEGHAGAVQSIAFNPDDTLLASGSWDRTIKLWDVASGQEVGNLLGHQREVLSVTFAPNGAVLASSSGDGTIRLWNVKTGIALLTLGHYPVGVNSVAFSPDGGVLAAGSDDKTVRLWEVGSGRLLFEMKGHLDAVKAVAFSRDMKYLVSGSRDETIKVWDVSTGRELRTLKGHFSSVDYIACSPDGNTLASASYDKTIRLWDIATGQRIRTLEGHSQRVTGLAFGPDGTTLVSGSALEPAETPSLHILAIGISQTKDPKLNLKFAAKDARDIVEALEKVGRGKFERITPHLILDEEATRGSIERAFEQIIAEVRPIDTFVFFYSGHDVVGRGESKSIEPQIYLTPTGIDPRDRKAVVSAGLSAALLQSWFRKIECQHQLVILDASESYRGVEKFVEKIERENRNLGPLLKRDMTVVAVEGESFELTGHENGFLTRTILKGLSGETVTGFGGSVALEKEITANDLMIFLRRASDVYGYTLAMKDARFTTFRVGADFPIGVISKPIVPKKKKAQEPHQLLSVKFTEMGRPPTMGTDLPRQITYVPGLIETSDSSTSQQTGSPGNGAQDSNTKVVRTGRDYALIIATNNYDQWPHLDNPIADAHSIAEELEKYYGFKTEVVENPNREAILRVLLRYRRQVYAADDQLFIFFAGHGTFLEDFQDGFIVAKDSKRDDELGDSYISHSLLRRVIDSFPCKHILLVLDACFSGTFDELVAKRRGGDEGEVPPYPSIYERRMQFRTRQFLTSGGKEYVPDGRPGQHSPFARKFLEALRSYGGRDGLLTITGVLSYVERGIPPPGRGEWGGNEPGSDFFFVVRMPKYPGIWFRVFFL